MSLGVSALTVVATAEEELQVTPGSETSLLERYISASSDAIAKYLGRTVYYSASIVETLHPRPRADEERRVRLVLARYPIIAVASVVDSDSNAITDYTRDDEAGVLRRLGPHFEPACRWDGSVTVTYSAGWVTPQQAVLDHALTRSLPFDIEHACLMTVVCLRRNRGRDPGIASETIGPSTTSYGGLNASTGRGVGGIIPDNARAILDRYREARLA